MSPDSRETQHLTTTVVGHQYKSPTTLTLVSAQCCELCPGQWRDMEARLDAGSNGEEGPAGETQYVAGNAGHKSSTTL